MASLMSKEGVYLLFCHQPDIIVETMDLLLNSFLVIVVAEKDKSLGYRQCEQIRRNGPVIEEQQLEVFGTDGNSVAKEGRASFCCILFRLQDVKVLSNLRDFLAALAALYLPLVTDSLTDCHFRNSTQRVTFET